MLSLEKWRELMGYNPYHFWQLSNDSVPVSSACNSLVGEYGWQNADAAGRDDIKHAIKTAENRLREYLGYRVGAEYVEKELIYPRPRDARQQYGRNADASGRYLGVNVREGFIKAIGTEAFETLDDDAAVVYTDANGDGVTDTATITILGVSSTLDTRQVTVYFADADRADGSTGTQESKFKIEPITARLNGTTLTITIKSWLMVRPIKYDNAVGVVKFDPNDTTLATNNFAQTVQVYRRYTNTEGTTTATSQAVLIWEADPPDWAECNTTNPVISTDPAAIGTAVARAGIRDARLGEVIAGKAVYNSTSQTWGGVDWNTWRQPDRLKVRLYAGADLNELAENVPDSGNWDVIIARLATAELNRRICSCDEANREIKEWQTDLTRISGNADELYRITETDLANPFGARRGHLYAWRQCKNLALTRAYAI